MKKNVFLLVQHLDCQVALKCPEVWIRFETVCSFNCDSTSYLQTGLNQRQGHKNAITHPCFGQSWGEGFRACSDDYHRARFSISVPAVKIIEQIHAEM